MTYLRLGLIGDNIARSQAPRLHRLAGQQTGLSVTYDRLVPKTLGQDFDAVFDNCAKGDYRGVNITYPFKELAARKVRISDPLVRAIGAVNTVVFDTDGPRGHNTDYSGFMAAYRGQRGETPPGTVCLIGTGGVGRAIAFGLVALGAGALRLVDRDAGKAEGLARDLRQAAPALDVTIFPTSEAAARGAAGIVNCTPVGMIGYEGTPVACDALAGADWAFDAVYTPQDTRFLADAEAEGLAVISGYELFIYQGLHAWDIFAGRPLDEATMRADLLSGKDVDSVQEAGRAAASGR